MCGKVQPQRPSPDIILRWMFEARCQAALELAVIGQALKRRLDGRERGMGQFLWFHEYFLVRLREMGTEQLW